MSTTSEYAAPLAQRPGEKTFFGQPRGLATLFFTEMWERFSYYGGVKLGTGGLSRAYSSGVKLALDALPTEPKIDRIPVAIVIGYENVAEIQRLMADMEVVVEAEEYGERVQFRCTVPTAGFKTFAAAVADATGGTGSVTKRSGSSA